MRAVRILGRSAALWLATAAGLAAVGAVLASGGPAARKDRHRARILRWWARAAARILGIRLRVEGPRPSGAFLLASNHLSYVDVVVIASQVDCTFVARADLARWPVLGALSRAAGILYVDRKNKRLLPRAIAEIGSALRGGRGVVVFPEGTTTAGEALAPLRAPLLEAATREGRGVHHARVRYRTLPGSPPAASSVCWWGDMTFWKHLASLLGTPGFAARLDFGAAPVLASDRKVVARELLVHLQRPRRRWGH